jgi:hypothetical protein
VPLADLARVLAHDVQDGSTGRGGYSISGDLTAEVFADDCRFLDPTNDVVGLARYQKALSILFDPQASSVALVAGPVVDAATGTITVRTRSEGVLKLPWRPRIAPWESEVIWTVNSDTGLIQTQTQTWNITAAEALRETFTPFR